MDLLQDECWEQRCIYSGLNAKRKDEFLLQVEWWEQGCIYSGLNAKRKDEFLQVEW